MSFLSPWFLLGSLAIAGPMVFHLIRRSARERTYFSSLLFLKPTPPQATRRRKFEHILLLVLRCLGVLLLACGFARPFLKSRTLPKPGPEQGRQLILLLDTSASMRREGLWSNARARAEKYLANSSAADRISVMTFDQQPRTILSFQEWLQAPVRERVALARTRLAACKPSWAGTQLGTALITAAEQFSDGADALAITSTRDMAVISDFGEGANLDRVQGHDWPKRMRVILEPVFPARPGNAGLELLNHGAGLEGEAPRARIVNSRDAKHEQFQLAWLTSTEADSSVKPLPVYVAPGQSRILAAPSLPPHAATAVLRLTGDEEEFDNQCYYVLPEVQRVTIAYFGSESPNDPAQLLYYLRRAFPEETRRHVDIHPVAAISQDALKAAALGVVASPLEAQEAQTLRDWLKEGRTALLVVTSSQMGPTLQALIGSPVGDIKEAAGDYALLGEIDFTHPLFAPFAEPRFSDFSHIHFWKHRLLDFSQAGPVRVLAKFDDGSPAFSQVLIGHGTLLVLAAGWNPGDSQLAVSTKFLPLMQTILDWTGSAIPPRTQWQVGDRIPSSFGNGPVAWQKPDGTTLTLPADQAFTDTEAPGIYTQTSGSHARHFAVNVPAAESRTTPLSPDDLARMGLPLSTSTEQVELAQLKRPQQAQQEQLENRQQIWRYFIVGLLILGLLEVLLGGWVGGKLRQPEVSA